MKKFRWLLFVLLAGMLIACGTEEAENQEINVLKENQIYAYFVNPEKTDVVQRVYTVDQNKELLENVDLLIQYLAKQPEQSEQTDYQSPIPAGITYVESRQGKRHGSLEIAFDILYDSVNAESMLFFKTCVAKSLLQLEGVETVSVFMTDVANSNAETATVSESFNEDSFAMSFGDESGYKQKGTIRLYFANESGEALKEYHKTVEITNNTSLAKMVVESMISGPSREGYTATIPENTTIRNLSVKDGICYVDLSDEFYDTNNPLKNDIIVYSVVNSLVELPTVSKVQFLKNGEKQQFFRETMPFDGIFERNLDLIEQEETVE